MSVSRLAVVNSFANIGINATPVTVEVHLSNGLPKFQLVGMPETAVKESKERVRSAIINSQFKFPTNYHITVNLAPADLPKTGGRFDLPIAIGILVASGQLKIDNLDQYAFVGELALTGTIRKVNALLPVTVISATQQKILFMPNPMAGELLPVEKLCAYVANHLVQICRHFQGSEKMQLWEFQYETIPELYSVDMAEVKGLAQGKRAMEIAASGRHNILLNGPPGTGKSMLAERIITILPQLNERQQLEVASLFSVAGIQRFNSKQPPLRSPHHSASVVSIVGGGSNPLPGEISLAHWGILYLDELPEFPRAIMESLREPLESRQISISRRTYESTISG